MTILIAASAFAADAATEAEMRARLCARLKTKVVLGAIGRADCVPDPHVVEVSWADRWHEGLARCYATATGKRPDLVLLCRMDDAA